MQIKVENLIKTYQQSKGNAHREVLKSLNLEITEGEKVAIMGPSGSGKTTLLNLIGTLDVPTEGQIKIEGQLISEMSSEEMLYFRSKNVGFVFQFHHLLPQCTLLENVLLPSLTQKGDKKMFIQHAEELLTYLGVWKQRNNKPEALSGGECQRAAVARALSNKPKILLADEPTGSLDNKNATLLIDLLVDINQKMNITLIIATHSLEIAQRMDKIFTINDGKLEKWEQ
jgi:lipoprotein-releasing system ATP-binding protein